MKADQKRTIRLNALLLGGVALSFYLGFILMAVLGVQ